MPHHSTRISVEERFWAKVDKAGECWEWTAFRHKGYGRFKQFRAHRVAWELTYGPIPAGMVVMHICDNPGCVRPDHLRLGTQLENIKDRDVKGRQGTRRGSSNPQAKLTEEQARSIRQRYQRGGVIIKELAAEYGVGTSTIFRIIRGQTWRHVS